MRAFRAPSKSVRARVRQSRRDSLRTGPGRHLGRHLDFPRTLLRRRSKRLYRWHRAESVYAPFRSKIDIRFVSGVSSSSSSNGGGVGARMDAAKSAPGSEGSDSDPFGDCVHAAGGVMVRSSILASPLLPRWPSPLPSCTVCSAFPSHPSPGGRARVISYQCEAHGPECARMG